MKENQETDQRKIVVPNSNKSDESDNESIE